MRVYAFALQLILLIQLVVIYCFAIAYRKQTDIHARLMVCTALTILDPIVARILAKYLTGVLPYLTWYPLNAQITTAVMIVLIGSGLSWMDWRYHKRRDVFLPVTVFLAVTWVMILGIGIFPSWNAVWGIVTEAYASIPIPS